MTKMGSARNVLTLLKNSGKFLISKTANVICICKSMLCTELKTENQMCVAALDQKLRMSENWKNFTDENSRTISSYPGHEQQPISRSVFAADTWNFPFLHIKWSGIFGKKIKKFWVGEWGKVGNLVDLARNDPVRRELIIWRAKYNGSWCVGCVMLTFAEQDKM